MENFIIISGLLCVIAGLICIKWIAANTEKKHQLVSTLELINDTKRLIGFTQKHRGLNAIYVQGNETVTSEILNLRQQIENLITAINEYPLIHLENRWDSYLDHWQRLVKTSMNLAPAQSFKQHTILIETLLYLLQDIAQRIELSDKKKGICKYYFLWQEFPQVIEYLGQSRAIGVATATKGTSTQVDKVKLGYLCGKIRLMSDSIFTKLEQLHNKQATNELAHTKELCINLTHLIKKELIDVDIVTLDGDGYFELASQAMNQCNQLLDKELEQIRLAHQ